MDNFREEIVVKRNQTLNSVLYVFCWVSIVLFGLLGLLLLNSTLLVLNFSDPIGIVLGLVFAGLAVLLYLKKDTLRAEYEYTFTNGEMDFARVLGNQRRKELGNMRVANVEACGHVSHESFQRYISMPGIRKDNWFLNREGNLFYFYFVKDGNKRIIIVEPSEEMVKLIRNYVGQGKYQG